MKAESEKVRREGVKKKEVEMRWRRGRGGWDKKSEEKRGGGVRNEKRKEVGKNKGKR